MDTWAELRDAAPAEPAPRAGRRRVLPVVVVVLLLVGLAVAGWLALRAFQAATGLRSAAQGVVQIRDDVAAGRTDGLSATAEEVADDARRAADATSDPVWWVAEHLPVVGVDAVAVRTAAQAVDELASEVLTPLAALARTVDRDALRIVDGRLDPAPLVAAQPVLDRAAQATTRVEERVAALDPARLHGPLVEPITELQSQLAAAEDALSLASRVATLLPPMLGAQEPRSYLVLFLNSAEVRAQGGIVGTVAVITADDGRLALTAQASSADMPRFAEPVLPLTDAELAVASDVIGRRIQNPVILPDTPRAGELAAEMWRRARGQAVDGVVMVDAVALSYLLAALGEVRHPAGETLTADTLVRTLLFTVYERQSDPAESDAFFAQAASAAFAALASGAGDPAELVDGLSRAVAERRLSVWSAHPEEQSLILGTPVDGALLSGGHDGAVGIFLDNTSGWKTDTYLRTSVDLVEARCEGGTVTLDLALELTSTLPADASDLPYYVVGDGSSAVAVGTMRMRVSVYSPVGGEVVTVRRGDTFLGASGADMAGRQVRVVTETLPPGETATYRLTVTAPARGARIPVWTTPTTSGPGITEVEAACAG